MHHLVATLMLMANLVFIDGLNVAYWCGTPPSLRFPLALMAGLQNTGRQAQLYFDASAPHRLAHEAEVYAKLRQHPQVVQVPSGQRADGLMLRQARDSGGLIISRDRYRDYRRKYRRLIDDPERCLPGEVREDRLIVPGLGLDRALLPSACAAWEMLTLL